MEMNTVFAGKGNVDTPATIKFIPIGISGTGALKGFPNVDLSVPSKKGQNQIHLEFNTPWYEIDMAYRYISTHLGDLNQNLDLAKPFDTKNIDEVFSWSGDMGRISRYSQESYMKIATRLTEQLENVDQNSMLNNILVPELLAKSIVFMYRKKTLFTSNYRQFIKTEETRNELVDLAKSCLSNVILQCAAKDIFDYSEACQALKERVDQQIDTIKNKDFSVSFTPENINEFQKSLLAVSKRTSIVNMKIKRETAPYRFLIKHAEKEIVKERKKQLIKQKRKK